jgi:hypothetical protein
MSTERHHGQVIGPDINSDGHKHGDQAEPEAPIMMRALPVGDMAMMTLAHGMRVFRVVPSFSPAAAGCAPIFVL